MNSALFFLILILIIILLLIIRIAWDIFATSVTVSLWKNSSGNISLQRFGIWLGIIGFIILLLRIFKK